MTPTHLAIAISTCLFISVSASPAWAADLAYKKLSGNSVELVLSSDTSLTVDQAQAMVAEPAVKLCNGKIPEFGKYKFSSNDPIAGQPASNKTSFNMVQILNCVADIPERPKQAISKLNEDDIARFKIEGNKLSNAYMSAIDNGYYEVAYNMLGKSLKNLSPMEEWQTRTVAYQAQIGKQLSRDFWRITVYDNPPNAYQAGTYVAVDYETKQSIAPITCGYLIWFQPAGTKNNFTLMREEYGPISEDILKSTAAADMGKLRKQMKCKT
ncbi:DUF4019 domain-containing protein [Undibacterium sp. Ji42W]|uniref:DUF4019 domain-containing protein n=1 Tax=Undibacterium sp. Ji42W TaxID=3413039 RepID=UPI003BEF9FD3